MTTQNEFLLSREPPEFYVRIIEQYKSSSRKIILRCDLLHDLRAPFRFRDDHASCIAGKWLIGECIHLKKGFRHHDLIYHKDDMYSLAKTDADFEILAVTDGNSPKF
jgi:hypothetical protein